MILLAKESGADCVKFQKSHLPSKFNKKALMRPYISPNSWGATYGDHKNYLEFDDNDFIELQNFAHSKNIIFSSSVMDEVSLNFLNNLDVPFIKIGSGDAHNFKLLKLASRLGKPLIISTGMSHISDVIEIYNLLKSNHMNFSLLHCTSSYPVPFDEINLNVIKSYKKLFPDINIGYSGHELGIDVPLGAVALGAKIIEKHFTLDKSLKGTDHKCSLTPLEFKQMVSNIRDFERNKIQLETIFSKDEVKKSLGAHEKKFQKSEKTCYEKLGKTVVAVKPLKKGDVITWDNVSLKVAEPKGIPGNYLHNIIGKTINKTVDEDESILENFFT